MIEYALCYARHGIPVFPIKPKTKTGYYCYTDYRGDPNHNYPEGTPYSWKAQASTDLDRVRRFWTDHPDANIGGVTGHGYLVIDLDTEHVNVDGNGNKTLIEDGRERLRKWQKETGLQLNEETAMSLTGRGGNQLFYRSDRQLAGSSDIFSDHTGCDTRGIGNYVLLPPSIHPNGSPYVWEQSPDEYPIIEADNALYAYWRGSSTASGNREKFDPLQKVTSARHNYMTSYVAWMLNTYPNLKQSEYEDMLRKKNESDIFPPLGQNHDDKPDELERTIFPYIPKVMIKDGTRRQEQIKAADEYAAAVQTDDYWNSLMNTVPSTDVQTEDPVSEDDGVITMDDIEEKETEWLVKGFIPKGCITILAATGGTGKSTLWASLLASLSNGKPTILEGRSGMEREPAKVMFFTTEDDPERVVKPKLRKCHADMKNVITVMPTDKHFKDVVIGSEYFESLIKKYRPVVCVFDPLQSFINKNVRMSERNAMRQSLEPLLTLGMKYGTTFIILMHTNKQNGAYGRQRIADSSDMWDIARSVIMMGDTNEDGLKYISAEKHSYIPEQPQTILFRIVDSVPTFKGYTDKTDRDYILEETKKRNNGGTDPVQECCNIILSELSSVNDKHRMPVKDMDDLLQSMGYSCRNIRDAKKNLKDGNQIGFKKTGFGDAIVEIFRIYENQ